MGTLYREEVQCYNRDNLLFFLGIMGLCFTVLLLCFSWDVLLIYKNYKIVFVLVGIVALINCIRFKKNLKRVYRYEIIDNEILIEDVTKGKRIVKLNFNAKSIVSMDSANDKKRKGYCIHRHYNFSNAFDSKNPKKCIFERDGKLYSFKFNPSQVFLNKIESLRLRAQ